MREFRDEPVVHVVEDVSYQSELGEASMTSRRVKVPARFRTS